MKLGEKHIKVRGVTIIVMLNNPKFLILVLYYSIPITYSDLQLRLVFGCVVKVNSALELFQSSGLAHTTVLTTMITKNSRRSPRANKLLKLTWSVCRCRTVGINFGLTERVINDEITAQNVKCVECWSYVAINQSVTLRGYGKAELGI